MGRQLFKKKTFSLDLYREEFAANFQSRVDPLQGDPPLRKANRKWLELNFTAEKHREADLQNFYQPNMLEIHSFKFYLLPL